MAKQQNPTPQPMPQQTGSGGFSPDFSVGGGSVPVVLPTCEPSGLWLYSHHRSRWIVMDGVLVPSLTQIPMAGGVGGVEARLEKLPDGSTRTKYDLTMLRSNREVRGHVVIERGGLAGDYVKGHQVRGGYVYLDQHATPIPGLPRIKWDRPGYIRWARGLVDSGLIAPPDAMVLDMLIASATRELHAASDRALSRPSEKVTADKIQKSLDVLRAERAKLEN